MAGGRPLGTFSDPARRARAWHWLAATMALACVDKARDLDRPDSSSSRGLDRKPRFDQVRQDGYDPDRVTAFGTTSLVDHLGSKRRFKSTRTIYRHMLWTHLEEWAPAWPERTAWLAEQLRRHLIVRYIPEDEENGVELGLLSDPDPLEPISPPPLNLTAERFATLDGLLLLLVLHREAQDAAHLDRADGLKFALRQAAKLFADQFNYHDEARDTWELMIGSRMVEWHPRVEPTADAWERAEDQLHQAGAHYRSSRKRAGPPGLNARTRSERRWRRRIWVRACCLYLEWGRGTQSFNYRDSSPLFEWLVRHREMINQHRTWAIEWLLLGEDDAGPNGLTPLMMPEELYFRRRRPSMTEREWQVFGETSPYDVIPVILQR